VPPSKNLSNSDIKEAPIPQTVKGQGSPPGAFAGLQRATAKSCKIRIILNRDLIPPKHDYLFENGIRF
jgi:hypothetical protein